MIESTALRKCNEGIKMIFSIKIVKTKFLFTPNPSDKINKKLKLNRAIQTLLNHYDTKE